MKTAKLEISKITDQGLINLIEENRKNLILPSIDPKANEKVCSTTGIINIMDQIEEYYEDEGLEISVTIEDMDFAFVWMMENVTNTDFYYFGEKDRGFEKVFDLLTEGQVIGGKRIKINLSKNREIQISDK